MLARKNDFNLNTAHTRGLIYINVISQIDTYLTKNWFNNKVQLN